MYNVFVLVKKLCPVGDQIPKTEYSNSENIWIPNLYLFGNQIPFKYLTFFVIHAMAWI